MTNPTFFDYAPSGRDHVIDIDSGFDSAVDRVVDALATEGFSVLARVSIDEAFRESLGIDFRRYTLLCTCNPKLAHRTLCTDPNVVTMLPSILCIEETQLGSRVRLADPVATMTAGGSSSGPELREVVIDAGLRLARAAATIAKLSGSD